MKKSERNLLSDAAAYLTELGHPDLAGRLDALVSHDVEVSARRTMIGTAQEHYAIALLLRRGFDVYTCAADTRGIDCIVRLGVDRYADLQIKMRSSEAATEGRFAGLSLPHTVPNGFLFLWLDSLDSYWIIPFAEIARRGRQPGLHVSRGQSPYDYGLYTIDLARMEKGRLSPWPDFEPFRDDGGLDLLRNVGFASAQ